MKKIIYLPIVVAALLIACNNSNTGGHSHDTIGGHADHDDHGHASIAIGAGALSYTLFQNDFELFVEFPALTIGQTSSFAAHFTQLSTYKPVSQGKLTVSLVKGGKGIRHSVDAPASPGIFRPALQPKEAGVYKLLFELKSETGNVTFEIPDIQVYANADEAAHAIVEEDDGEAISYSKEQAWKTDFATQEVAYKPFYSVIHTSAKVKGQPHSTITLNAQVEGAVNLMTVIGESVKKGDLLAVITGSGIENNISLKLNESKIAFDKSKADYIRSKPLSEKQIVSQKDFLEVQSRYQQDSLHYYQLANVVSKKGLKVLAPFDGFVSNIAANNGQFVSNGASILTVNSKSELMIEAFVNQSDFQKVSGIFDANFAFAENKETITLQEINGKVASKNAFVNESTTRIPVTFSAQNNGKLMPGMFLEAFLKTGKKDKALVVPLTSIIEEQGQYFVFVQTGGESFVKRQIELANTDGIHTEITKGLTNGERIVTVGAYQVKLASLAGDLPIHGHAH